MANRTDPSALQVHGTNPQFIVDKTVRMKIWSSPYWKEECFALNEETIVDKAIALEYIGGTYGGMAAPTKFLCLVLKLLQIQPDKEIVYEFIKNTDYKYVRALGCFYLRLIGKPEEVYEYLEPLYNDYRKLRYRNADGTFKIIHMDEFIDEILTQEQVCSIQLPRILKRQQLEEAGTLKERKSALEDLEDDDEAVKAVNEEYEREQKKDHMTLMDKVEEYDRTHPKEGEPKEGTEQDGEVVRRKDGEEDGKAEKKRKKHKKHRSRSRSGSRKRRSSSSRSKSRSRSRDRKKKKKRSRSRSSSSRSSRSSSREKKKHRKHKHSSEWKKRLKEKRKERKEKEKEKKDDRTDKEPSGKEDKKAEEFSVEYWNQIRAKMGMTLLPTDN